MFGLTERPYSAHMLISFWCDSDNKNFWLSCVSEFMGIFQFCSFWLLSKFAVCILALGNLPIQFFWRFSASSTKSKMACWFKGITLPGCVLNCFYIIGTHSNNVLIWFTKRILGNFFCVHIMCVPNHSHLLKCSKTHRFSFLSFHSVQ